MCAGRQKTSMLSFNTGCLAHSPCGMVWKAHFRGEIWAQVQPSLLSPHGTALVSQQQKWRTPLSSKGDWECQITPTKTSKPTCPNGNPPSSPGPALFLGQRFLPRSECCAVAHARSLRVTSDSPANRITASSYGYSPQLALDLTCFCPSLVLLWEDCSPHIFAASPP